MLFDQTQVIYISLYTVLVTCTASTTTSAVITPPLPPLTKNVTCSPLSVCSTLVMTISFAETSTAFCLC